MESPIPSFFITTAEVPYTLILKKRIGPYEIPYRTAAVFGRKGNKEQLKEGLAKQDAAAAAPHYGTQHRSAATHPVQVSAGTHRHASLIPPHGLSGQGSDALGEAVTYPASCVMLQKLFSDLSSNHTQP